MLDNFLVNVFNKLPAIYSLFCGKWWTIIINNVEVITNKFGAEYCVILIENFCLLPPNYHEIMPNILQCPCQ